MAFAVADKSEFPIHTLLSEYHVYRSGNYPIVRIKYDEVVYLTENFTVKTATYSSGSLYDVLEIPDLANHTDITNSLVTNSTGSEIGEVLSFETVELSPEVRETDSTGVVINYTPAVYTAYVTLKVGVSTDLSGKTIGIVKKMPIGTNAFRKSVGGMEWSLILDGSNPTAMQKISSMLGTVFFSSVKKGIEQLISSKSGSAQLSSITDADIFSVVQTLAANQINADSILAEQGELLELDRRSGNAPYVIIEGIAP